MRRKIAPVFICFLLVGACSSTLADVAYDFEFTTTYQFGFPTDLVGGPAGNPDTGFAHLVNLGTSTLNGTFSIVAIRGNGFDDSRSFVVSLAPGGSISLSADDESSNVGGFNGATGTIQNGIELLFSGTADLGLNSAGISVSAFDKDIHSGVSRDGGCGPTDAYVLQGGCPTGGDTGDAFETTQAPGLLEFSHTPSGGAVPEPGSIILVGTGLLAMAGIVRRRSLNSR